MERGERGTITPTRRNVNTYFYWKNKRRVRGKDGVGREAVPLQRGRDGGRVGGRKGGKTH